MPEEHIEHLLNDDSFIRWIRGEAGDTEKKKWERWLKEDPARSVNMQQAKELYSSLQFREEIPNTIGELNRLRDAVERHKKFSLTGRSRGYYWASVIMVAGTLLVVTLIAQHAGWSSETGETIAGPVFNTTQTEYGQIRNLIFPDGSTVALNANSRLSYPATMTDRDVEMELEGEAWFSVAPRKGENRRAFSVRTTDGKVTVLGTRFNVNTRKQQTEVVLEEGKIVVEPADTTTPAQSQDLYTYTMSPGELVRFSIDRSEVETETVKPELYTSWRNLEWKFEETPLSNIAERIEHAYGVEVTFAEESHREIRFSGTAPSQSLSVLLQGLRVLLDVPIHEEINRITIGG